MSVVEPVRECSAETADAPRRGPVAIERLTNRAVVAFLTASHTAPGVACELFFLARCLSIGRVDRSRMPVRAGPGPVGEAQLMTEVSLGNLEAFAEIYDRYCHQAYGVAFSVCGDEGRAQDAVQEGFLSVWKSSASYRSQQGTVAAWLLTVVRHRAIDLARRNGNHATRRASEASLDERPALDEVSEEVIQRDNADHLRRSLDMLSDEQREVITLAYYGQLSHTEIATQLGIPSGTVKGRMRLGLQKLRATNTPAAA